MSAKNTNNGAGSDEAQSLDFIREIVEEDLEKGKYEGRVHTRFPPEPNAYPHLGHAYAAYFNYMLAQDYDGQFNLRFDDTNPLTEEQKYVEAFIEDLRWLGIDWEDRLFFASDYFGRMYDWAVQLVEQGDAYVDSLSAEEISKYRGSWNEPGKESPYRDRSVEENLDLLECMKNGDLEEGECVLRAKIDMSHDNQNMRDPVMYRIIHAEHYRTGDEWCIYPTYDWAHGLEDSIEGITHSICSIEFENHRPLYNWFLEHLDIYHPQQIEFARFNLSNTIMSKRKLLELVDEGYVEGLDDPRLPTISGMRRRGYTPGALREFIGKVGVSKTPSTVEMALLEHCLRQDLNRRCERRMGVLRPLKVVIENYPEGKEEELEFINNPEDESAGTRMVPFSRELFIERDDFMEEPVKKFYRLAPGREVRLRYAYFLKCEDLVKDENGNVIELRCSYDPETRGGSAPDGRKVKATLHWVSARHALDVTVRIYERLLLDEDVVGEDADWKDRLNPESCRVLKACKVEPSLAEAESGARFQFERKGYYCVDRDSSPEKMVFNQTVTMRDQWRKIQKRRKQQKKQGG
ncbi:MAG: glutamine--tRNA ligase/YqeY domain fusion protein [Planctomycetes bacterium]|nr:glutamine--tRNA ligase/YqeY domain fusion protein [Planctomycetota bacterium]